MSSGLASMKSADTWQFEILRPGTSKPYAEIRHRGDKYVVGVHTQPFEFRVTAPASSHYPCCKVKLAVDGNSIGYSQILESPCRTATSRGFANTAHGEHLGSQFRCCKAQTDSLAQSGLSSTTKIGSLRINIERCLKVQQKVSIQHISSRVPDPVTTKEGNVLACTPT